MAERNARRFFAAGDPVPGRLEPITERRMIGFTMDPDKGLTPKIQTFIVGHGQQLARKRESERPAAPAPEFTLSRQVKRRARRIVASVESTKARREADLAALKAMRAKRAEREKLAGPTVKQGPGKMLATDARGRRQKSFKKPHGQHSWRTRDLTQRERDALGLNHLPPAYEVTMHATKGFRVVRQAA